MSTFFSEICGLLDIVAEISVDMISSGLVLSFMALP